MTERTQANERDGQPLGDLGRRLVARREQLGLNREETAARAGMAASYLSHLEEHSVAAPGAGVLLKLADALETTVTELTGGNADLPPGRGQAARTPEFRELSTYECRALLSTHGVGRLALSTAEGPVIVPVNYSVVDGAVVFRTAAGATPALAVGCRVAFEADRIDEVFSRGWSVLVRGDARSVTDPEEARRLDRRAYSTPWAGGRRDLWVRLDPIAISGRRITV
ncbi:helix-turn-helix domain-containing protein [Streptomyces resistomycificus]|uniref:DNA-binding protein n=1 Tax=Streptomyces resistomycificus TaxID=67356 RepID=A0A0L8LG64_9ACTN|nr:pyridoxamine 5'-phosphate oxidase family protein [Streptomyces resistomycificus]KOG37099.1 DNA-binding protein [Streptomyces resistomycificus]KUN95046.1 DNA-binding protein [Streptomyces resistomycificus]